MTAYAIGQIEITDPERYQQYLEGFMPIFERYGGVLLAVTSGKTTVVEGSWGYPATVILQFPDRSAAERWLADPEYKALAEHRYASANTNLAIVDGIG